MKTLLLTTSLVGMSVAHSQPHSEMFSAMTDMRIYRNIKRFLQGQDVIKEGSACTVDLECSSVNPYLMCEEETKVCGHKGVFPL